MSTLIYGGILLGVLVFVHELGHFLVAKASGVRVLTFSLGFGPRIFGFTKGDTDYRVSAIPLGGYVRMYGDDILEEIPLEEQDKSFLHKPTLQKSAIAFAGPLANFLLPIGLFFFLFLGTETVPGSTVGTVVPGHPAAAAGLEAGDRIVEVAGVPVTTFLEVQKAVEERPAQKTEVVVERDGKRKALVITPDAVPSLHPLKKDEKVGRVGVMPNVQRPFVRALPGTPAAEAGIEPLDEVVVVNGVEVTSLGAYQRALAAAGDTVELQIKKQPLKLLEEKGSEDGADVVTVTLSKPVTEPEPETETDSDSATDSEPEPATGPDSETETVAAEEPAAPPPAPSPEPARAPDPAADARFAVTAQELEEPAIRERFDATWRAATKQTQSARFGLLPYEGSIAKVEEDTPAARLGVAEGDTVLAVDGEPVHVASEVSSRLLTAPDEVHALAMMTAEGELRTLVFRLAPEKQRGREDFKTFGAWPSGDTYSAGVTITRDVGVGAAFTRAVQETGKWIGLTLKSLWMLVTGDVSPKSLGGPITIVRIAGQAAESGLSSFINLMAFISVNLGIVNLLPIPVLDGGHLMMFGIEAVSRQRISLQTRERATKVGFAMLLCLLAVALFNDVLGLL